MRTIVLSEVKWTVEQRLAIETVDRNVLLTASAGSGKTAVLAERVVHLLTGAKRRCDVDALLVLTFTEAAASEMRGRIAKELRRRAKQDGRLRKQLILLDKANISTVHAFCNSLLREFYYLVGLDGTFEIMDGYEAELLKVQIADELFEEAYEREELDGHARERAAFGEFVAAYGGKSGDHELVNLVVHLHNFMDSVKDHDKWLRRWRSVLGDEAVTDVNELALVKRQRQVLAGRIERLISQCEYGVRLIGFMPVLDFYGPYIQNELIDQFEGIKKRLADGKMDEAMCALGTLEYGRLPSKSGVSAAEKMPVKSIIDDVKKGAKKLASQFGVSGKDVAAQGRYVGRFGEVLVELNREFSRRYEAAKREGNMLDFADLERLSLEILQGHEEVAQQVRGRFEYVLVDEYQDISPVQEAIIQCVSRTDNLFMVGDVKQSIYGFRQADPDIFLAKYRAYADVNEEAGAEQVRIGLDRNFRTRKEVVDGINYVFSRCMTEAVGGLDYASEGKLVYGASYYDEVEGGGDVKGEVEWHFVEKELGDGAGHAGGDDEGENDGDDLDASRREAVIVARRIRELVEGGTDCGVEPMQVYDKKTGGMRPVGYRDVVVLLRSMKMRAEIWSEVFAAMGVPVHAELSSGYFVATEVADMLSLLMVMDNPQQDIPLAAVLRSAMVGLSESELVRVRQSLPKGSFYEALCGYAEAGADDELKEKVKAFLEQLNDWRDRARRGNLSSLIWEIYRESGFLAYVSGLTAGKQRYGNLLHLYDTARRFDGFSRQGLGRFLRFIETLREEEGDFGPAPVVTEADDVVRLMSVHKSKGLEFPVVVVAGLSRQFNRQESRNAILFNHSPAEDSCPVGLKAVDLESRYRWGTLSHAVVVEEMEKRSLAEEMRVLYVAMTRARERLILVATEDLEKVGEAWQGWRYDGGSALPRFLLEGANGPMDWLGPALAGHSDAAALFAGCDDVEVDGGAGETLRPGSGQAGARYRVVCYDGLAVKRIVAEAGVQKERPEVAGSVDELVCVGEGDVAAYGEAAAVVIDRLKWAYPHRQLAEFRARQSVTDLKHHQQLEDDGEFYSEPGVASQAVGSFVPGVFSKRPEFVTDESGAATGADRGSWTHLLLEKMDFSGAIDEAGLKEQLAGLVDTGYLTAVQAEVVDIASVAGMLTSELGQLIVGHKDCVQREWAFTLAVPAGEVYAGRPLADDERDEPILIRGIIDCLVRTDDGYVIVDYKTDRVTGAECGERAKHYEVPMRLYRRAVEGILGETVCGLYLYFLNAGQAVEVE